MISEREVRRVFGKYGGYEVSKDVIKNVKMNASKHLEADVIKLIEETNRQNELRRKLNITEIKRIDRNLYLNYLGKQLKDTNSYKFGEIGQENRETISLGDNIRRKKSKSDIIKEAIERGYL